jgi:hypothetical protein
MKIKIGGTPMMERKKNIELKNDEFTLENLQEDNGYDPDWGKESRFL